MTISLTPHASNRIFLSDDPNDEYPFRGEEVYIGSKGIVDIYAIANYGERYETSVFDKEARTWNPAPWRARYTDKQLENYTSYLSTGFTADFNHGQWSLTDVQLITYVDGLQTPATFEIKEVEFGVAPEANLVILEKPIFMKLEEVVRELIEDKYYEQVYTTLVDEAMETTRAYVRHLSEKVFV